MSENLFDDALEIFRAAVAASDARVAVERAVNCEADQLSIAGSVIPLKEISHIYAVAVGKAATQMARGLESALGARFSGGVLSGVPARDCDLSSRWQIFAGGHPLPNEASIEAAQAALQLLRQANHRRALIIFLISGGGSAMFELPADASLTLDDLRLTNEALISCGAHIREINAVRCKLSAVKGGKLARFAPLARQETLIVSDVPHNSYAAASVASGLTCSQTDMPDAREIVDRYQIGAQLPTNVRQAINSATAHQLPHASAQTIVPDAPTFGAQNFHLLLDNDLALEAAAKHARALGYDFVIARDIADQDVETGSRMLVERLLARVRDVGGAAKVCVVSGGEFACPVRGAGQGGRNTETALRCGAEFQRVRASFAERDAVALCAGTDGVDGNSPAAGAIADLYIIERARDAGMDYADFLTRSDSYNFFRQLGSSIVTGATGTNVRDLRVLLSVVKS